MGMDQGPTGEIVDIPEERLTTIHGVRVLHTTKYPIRAGDGRPKYLPGIAEDITELKAAEEGRRQAEEALRERVRVFTALAEFAGAVNSIRDPERLVATLGDAVSSILPTDTAVITVLDRGNGLYHVRSARGLAPGAVGCGHRTGRGGDGTGHHCARYRPAKLGSERIRLVHDAAIVTRQSD